MTVAELPDEKPERSEQSIGRIDLKLACVHLSNLKRAAYSNSEILKLLDRNFPQDFDTLTLNHFKDLILESI